MVKHYRVDEEGFLEDPADWDEAFVLLVAAQDSVDLDPERWELINTTRAFYSQYGFSPSMRPLTKFIGITLGPEKGRSIYLMQLFPPNPARALSKLAGLHKPKNCL
ncbi:MAG: sulfurtransferase TusE [Gammaproteobacteria bacterium BRH_c0]|nr:MAG: sulfurtransferase TusE [Gammaproteobacteria bacterium BRH_c0]